MQQAFPFAAVTLFPEDPGSSTFAQISHDGDGVLGKRNPLQGGARVNALGQLTGAVPFLINAILYEGINNIGMFGYSHGGGSIQATIQALAWHASQDSNLLSRLTSGDVKFFYTAYIDAVHMDFDIIDGEPEITGEAGAEGDFPVEEIPNIGFSYLLGSLWHYNVYQEAFPVLPFLTRDRVPINGKGLSLSEWIGLGRSPAFFVQDNTDANGQLWPNGTDHTNNKRHGIAEDPEVQAAVVLYMQNAWNDIIING